MAMKVNIDKNQNVFKSIFKDNWDAFKLSNPSYNCPQYNEAVEKMLDCGEFRSGFKEYTCMSCGHSHTVCFSCKNAFCLSCSVGYSDDVMNQIGSVLHPEMVYRHLVLTIPAQLRSPFYKERHNGKLLSEFMRLGYRYLEECVSGLRKRLLKIGCIVVIHTYGRSGQYKPHLHIIMTDGGINLETKKWVKLGYIDYAVLRKKWQYSLLTFVREFFGESLNSLVDKLWKKYPNGFVSNVSKGDVPSKNNGLAKYLAKYLSSPPISIKRILNYDGVCVSYRYNDHETKARKTETVSVFTFMGRMVQHITVKGFQKIRYYGLQATKTFKKWKDIILEGLRKLGKIVKGAYQVVASKSYRERYKQMSLFDPLICHQCGMEMELSYIWHPKYGVLYDLIKNSPVFNAGPEESKQGRSSPLVFENIQLSF